MHPYLQPRADDIEQHLGPVLRELGLRTRVVSNDGNPRFIFEQKRVKGLAKGMDRPFSPVAIEFHSRSETKLPEAPWIGAFVCIADWRFKELGNTGWRHRRLWETGGYMLRSFTNPEVHFAEIEGHIRERGIITPERLQPQIADSEELADAAIQIGNDIKGLEIVRFDDRELYPTEAMTFLDPEGQRIHLCFSFAGHGTILVDGQQAGTFSQSNEYRIRSIALDLSRGRAPQPRDVHGWSHGIPSGKR